MNAKERILVTDREPRWRRFITAVLRQAGYAVSSYEDTSESLREITESGSDLVLTDASLSEMTRALSAKHPNARFIVFTTSPSVSEAIDAYRLGALDYRNKAFDGSIVLEAVAEALTKPAVRSQRFF